MEYKSPYLFDIDHVYKTISQPPKDKLALNDEQQQGILACLQDKVTVITGGPGTGKTTLIKQLLKFLMNIGSSIDWQLQPAVLQNELLKAPAGMRQRSTVYLNLIQAL